MSEAVRPSPAAAPILHLQYRSLIQDPVGAVRTLYDRFDLPLGPDALAAMARYLAERKDGGYLKARYDPLTFGIDLRMEFRRFADYVDQFGMAREGEEPPAALSLGDAPVPVAAGAS